MLAMSVCGYAAAVKGIHFKPFGRDRLYKPFELGLKQGRVFSHFTC